jgi:uncharacterized protein
MRSLIDRYSYPHQDTEVRDGDALHLPDGADFGTVEAIDRVARAVDVKKRGAQADVHPAAVFAHSVVNADVLAEALLRIGEDVVRYGIMGGTDYCAARELLLIRPPRLRVGTHAPRPGENAVEFAVRISAELDRTVLAVQGPPAAGKTFTGARMICELVRRGARVGVTAVSHKVIRKLLDDGAKAAADLGVRMNSIHKVTTRRATPSGIEETTDNADALASAPLRQTGSGAGRHALALGSPGGTGSRRRPLRGCGGPDVARECSRGITGGRQRRAARRPTAARAAAAGNTSRGHGLLCAPN